MSLRAKILTSDGMDCQNDGMKKNETQQSFQLLVTTSYKIPTSLNIILKQIK